MSDPVSNAEVEDVLSSIRRLVSEDKRPLHVAQRDKPNDRLVLTPALRVAENEDHIEEDASLSDMDHEADTALDEPDLSDHGQTDAREEEQAHPDEQAEDNTGSIEDEIGRENAFDDPAHDYETDPYNFSDEADGDGEGDAEQFVKALQEEASDDAWSEGPEVVDTFDAEHESDLQSENFETAAQQGDAEQIFDELDEATDDTDAPVSKADTLRAKIEELETAIGSISGAWNGGRNRAETNPAHSGDAMAWEDDAPADAIAPRLHVFSSEPEPRDESDLQLADGIEELQEEVPQADDFAKYSENTESPVEPEPQVAAAAMDYVDEAQLIDEDALRDMVSEIVRAELQGALGERITRNVRKLVRREIHRALTAQDLE